MGRLVYLACTKNSELEKVFPFTLTLIPLSFVSMFDTVKKTPQYNLSKHLEDLITHTEPTVVNTVLYDAMFIIQSLPTNCLIILGK